MSGREENSGKTSLRRVTGELHYKQEHQNLMPEKQTNKKKTSCQEQEPLGKVEASMTASVCLPV